MWLLETEKHELSRVGSRNQSSESIFAWNWYWSL